MTGEQWTIYWNEYSSDTYLYGSEITYHKKDDVEFRNELMPPGTLIKVVFPDKLSGAEDRTGSAHD